jgi:hypothetical protein
VPLWIAYNGYMGYGPVGCIVSAATEDDARRLASEAFAAEQPGDPDYAVVKEIGLLELPYVGDSL